MVINNLSKMVLLAPDFHKGPDLTHERPAIIKSVAEGLGVSPEIGGVVVDVKKGVATVFIKGEAKSQTESLKDDLDLDKERDRLYDEEIRRNDEKFSLGNLDKILGDQYRFAIINESIERLFSGKLDKNFNIIIGNQTFVRGTPKYDEMITEALKEMAFVNKALLMNLKHEKSNAIFEMIRERESK